MTGAISGAGTTYPFITPELILIFCGIHVVQSNL
jgi:hypothetical protein